MWRRWSEKWLCSGEGKPAGGALYRGHVAMCRAAIPIAVLGWSHVTATASTRTAGTLEARLREWRARAVVCHCSGDCTHVIHTSHTESTAPQGTHPTARRRTAVGAGMSMCDTRVTARHDTVLGRAYAQPTLYSTRYRVPVVCCCVT